MKIEPSFELVALTMLLERQNKCRACGFAAERESKEHGDPLCEKCVPAWGARIDAANAASIARWDANIARGPVRDDQASPREWVESRGTVGPCGCLFIGDESYQSCARHFQERRRFREGWRPLESTQWIIYPHAALAARFNALLRGE